MTNSHPTDRSDKRSHTSIRIAGQDAKDRLMEAVTREHQLHGGGRPTPLQVAIVLHALADHTAIMYMLKHRPDPESPWPQATSVGRFFHDLGYEMEGRND